MFNLVKDDYDENLDDVIKSVNILLTDFITSSKFSS